MCSGSRCGQAIVAIPVKFLTKTNLNTFTFSPKIQSATAFGAFYRHIQVHGDDDNDHHRRISCNVSTILLKICVLGGSGAVKFVKV